MRVNLRVLGYGQKNTPHPTGNEERSRAGSPRKYGIGRGGAGAAFPGSSPGLPAPPGAGNRLPCSRRATGGVSWPPDWRNIRTCATAKHIMRRADRQQAFNEGGRDEVARPLAHAAGVRQFHRLLEFLVARESGEELVQEAVFRVARGTRAWNLKTSSPGLFLCSYKEIS